MSYATLTDLIARFGEEEFVQLAGFGQPGDDRIDESVIDAALADADALIDGYLRGRYDLPLAIVPPNLTGIAADIARYELRARVPRAQMSDQVRQRYEDALKTLQHIREGKLVLETGTAAPAPAANTIRHRPGGAPIKNSGMIGDYADGQGW